MTRGSSNAGRDLAVADPWIAQDDATRTTAPVAHECCVVFADMVGYSALSLRDESATHAMWMDFRAGCLAPVAAIHGGEVIRLLGDGCLLTFANADDALAWCLDVRGRIIDDRIGAVRRWQNLCLRFGAHATRAIREHDDIYGSGVNLAKRLQERAHGDGVLVSGPFLERLGADHGREFRYLGALEYRNIAEPLPTHELVFTERSPPVRDDRDELPSIALMPFANRTGDDDLDWFTEGVIDDVIQSLASLRELRVISRNSTVPLGAKTRDPVEIARILSVRYVLQGTLVGNGERGRLFVALEDARRGETLFSEKCEFSHSDLFAVQDTLVRRIVARITPGVRSAELEKALRKPPANFTAYQNTLRALDLMKSLDREDFVAARAHLEEAHRLDPQFALPVAWLARWHTVLVGQHWAEDREAAVEEAERTARLAISIDRENPLALAAYGHVLSYLKRDYETALVYFDRARQLSPSHALTWILSSATLSYLGKGNEAVEHARMALTLSPSDQDLHQFFDFTSIAYFAAGDLPTALQYAEMSRAERSGYVSNLKMLTVLNQALGYGDAARRHAADLRRVDPELTVSKYRAVGPWSVPSTVKFFARQLRAAGIPE